MTRSVVYNQDCLEAMRQMPDKAFDLAIVDPPYGLNAAAGGVGGKYLRIKFQNGTLESKPWDVLTPNAEYFDELQRISERQIIFGGNYFNFVGMPGYAIWDKGAGFRNRSFAECELLWMNFKSSAKVFSYDPLAHGDYSGKIHPTQKPIAVYDWILNTYAKLGETILDTHLGSGSSRIAAYDLGFDFTGYELDTDYYLAQEKRFAEYLAQPKLFTAPALEHTQEGLFS